MAWDKIKSLSGWGTRQATASERIAASQEQAERLVASVEQELEDLLRDLAKSAPATVATKKAA